MKLGCVRHTRTGVTFRPFRIDAVFDAGSRDRALSFIEALTTLVPLDEWSIHSSDDAIIVRASLSEFIEPTRLIAAADKQGGVIRFYLRDEKRDLITDNLFRQACSPGSEHSTTIADF